MWTWIIIFLIYSNIVYIYINSNYNDETSGSAGFALSFWWFFVLGLLYLIFDLVVVSYYLVISYLLVSISFYIAIKKNKKEEGKKFGLYLFIPRFYYGWFKDRTGTDFKTWFNNIFFDNKYEVVDGGYHSLDTSSNNTQEVFMDYNSNKDMIKYGQGQITRSKNEIEFHNNSVLDLVNSLQDELANQPRPLTIWGEQRQSERLKITADKVQTVVGIIKNLSMSVEDMAKLKAYKLFEQNAVLRALIENETLKQTISTVETDMKRRSEIAYEAQLLQNENQRLLNDRLFQENKKLYIENELLRNQNSIEFFKVRCEHDINLIDSTADANMKNAKSQKTFEINSLIKNITKDIEFNNLSDPLKNSIIIGLLFSNTDDPMKLQYQNSIINDAVETYRLERDKLYQSVEREKLETREKKLRQDDEFRDRDRRNGR